MINRINNRLNFSFHRILKAAAIGLLVIGHLVTGLGHSVAAAKSEKQKDEAAWIVPTHIQLAPVMIPVEGRRSAPVTFYLEARDKKFVGNICNYIPRIRDAIFKHLSRHPVPVSHRKLILKNIPQRLINPMNQSIGNQIIGNHQIKEVYIVAGAVRMGGGSISRLPFARINGCQSIRRAEAERMKAEAAKKQK